MRAFVCVYYLCSSSIKSGFKLQSRAARTVPAPCAQPPPMRGERDRCLGYRGSLSSWSAIAIALARALLLGIYLNVPSLSLARALLCVCVCRSFFSLDLSKTKMPPRYIAFLLTPLIFFYIHCREILCARLQDHDVFEQFLMCEYESFFFSYN